MIVLVWIKANCKTMKHYKKSFITSTSIGLSVLVSWLKCHVILVTYLTHVSLASFLWDIGKQYSPRCDATECGIPAVAILFAKRIFIKNFYEMLKSLLMPLKMKVDSLK